jgi:hypothetical protein
VSSRLNWSALFLAAGLVVGCGREIGDSCRTSIDCTQEQETERLCDISQPGGYCTIEGCDDRSCPEDSACIRFFPQLFLSKPCSMGCAPDELCLENGQGDGLCAPRRSERRYCARTCEDNGDCRDNYECRQAGDRGSAALTPNPNAVVRFCAPIGR